MRAAGVSSGRAAVVYDAGSGAAARAWWLLRYYGHPGVRVLDGGLRAWREAGGAVVSGPEPVPAPGDFVARPGGMPLLDAGGAARVAASGVLLDAREPKRFRGEEEPIDPVAGHIPGAVNLPSIGNVSETGRFLGPDELRARFEAAGVRGDAELGAYCGSGVAAAHEVLALALAGFPAGLYVGSWSDWITDAARPVARGEG
jgi:thiosulfate/3-mercaptopyruvate sulfurtransferase